MAVSERFPGLGVDRETALAVGLVSGSHFVNHMYLVLLPPVFAILVTEFEVGLTVLGFAVGLQGATSAAFQLPFGYLSDTRGRGVTLVTGLVLAAAGVFAVASAPTFEAVLLGQALLGVGLAAHHPAHFPMLSAATAESNRGRAFSFHGFAGNIGYAAAPALITLVLAVEGTGWRDAFLVVAAIGGGYALFAAAIVHGPLPDAVTAPPEADAEAVPELPSVRERVSAELRSIWNAPAILALAGVALVTSMANWGIRSYAVVLLTDGYGVGLSLANSTLTAMFALGAVVMLLGGELADRIAATPVLIVSYAALLVTVVAVGSLVVPWTAALGLVALAGAALSFGAPARSKLTDLLSDEADLGKNFALISVGVVVAGAVAPPLFGFIIETFGLRAAFYTVAAIGALAGVLVVVVVRRL